MLLKEKGFSVTVVGLGLALLVRANPLRAKAPKPMLRCLWPAVIVLIPLVASAVDPPLPELRSLTIEEREHQLSKSFTRGSQFADVRHISSAPECQEVHPPQALTTPDPLFPTPVYGRRVKVSFIIGTDGRVNSPLILESAGLSGDRRVLQAVRTWRYRPATCNGVPTETEGKVEFSTR